MTTDRRLDYVASSTATIAEYGRLTKELGQKRARALRGLMEDGWKITEIANATGINRQALYKAAKPKGEQ